MARASYAASARAMALGALSLAWFCAAAWPVFTPPLTSLSAHVEDMRGEAFRTLGPERRAAMYEDYIEMKAAALRLGRRAIRLIEVYARDGKDVAEAEAARMEELRRVEGVSSPGAVRSGL
ncbi:hypothetical protein JSE7799_00277 [Jannaschia seosinensis]|uniref:Uncharacterized protein n=1 Tax=Jannaschia seosinensis TaxID=313367 RepID=A0A0M7B6X6_9RHOB|nr:hypothetical protein [Jannaschia seosinensis]CUH14527.1 hypothetical protein JSE7799_00277 [Jannaschia seosinensis]